MTTIDALRPDVRPLDAEWSADTLATILADQDPSRARPRGRGRRRTLVGVSAVGLLGIGGVAFATGVVPPLVTSFFDQTAGPGMRDVHEVASFTTDAGGGPRTFEIWRGTDPEGLSCTAVLEASMAGPDFGGNCGDYPTDAWFNTSSEGWTGTIDDPPPPLTYYVYGEPTSPDVTRVRVLGAGFEHEVGVEVRTGGYAVAIPELSRGVRGRFATVEFLDADGGVVGTRELSEK